MIIGNPIMLGGGGGKYTVTFNAPKNSTIVYSGASSGTISLGNSTTASVTLREGTYTVESHLNLPSGASTTADTVIYTRTVGVSGDTTVNLYPDNIIYWYGITASGGGTWYSLTQPNVAFSTEYDNCLKLIWNGGTSGGTTQGAFRSNNPITFTSQSASFSRLKFRAAYENQTGSFYPNGGYWSNAWTTITDLPTNTSAVIADAQHQYEQQETSVTISSTGSSYVGVKVTATSAVVYAIWLE